MNGRQDNRGIPIEDFIQALSSQLDRVQSGMALKVKAGLPLTFAVKDLTLDLRAHVDVEGSEVRIRSVGPGDGEASTLRLALTTITRPMMEENTLRAAADPTDQSLHEAVGDELSPDDVRRLEWAGVQTISQLIKLRESAGDSAIGRIANVPALRLRAALDRASQPAIHDVQVEAPPGESWDRPAHSPLTGLDPSAAPWNVAPRPPLGVREPLGGRWEAETAPPTSEPTPAAEPIRTPDTPTIRFAGRNLLRDGLPTVRLGNEPLRIVSADANELVVRAPEGGMLSGMLEIETPAGVRLRHPLAPHERRTP